MKTHRFELEDVDRLMMQGEALPVEDQIWYFDSIHTFLKNCGERGDSLIDYALTVSTTNAISAVMRQAGQWQNQERWAESLKLCQLAERLLPFTAPQPYLFYLIGFAQWHLNQRKDAYEAFIKGEKTASLAIASPGQTEEARRYFMSLRDECHQNAQKLQVK